MMSREIIDILLKDVDDAIETLQGEITILEEYTDENDPEYDPDIPFIKKREVAEAFYDITIQALQQMRIQESCDFCKKVGEFATIDFLNCGMSDGVGVEHREPIYHCIKCGRKLEVEE